MKDRKKQENNKTLANHIQSYADLVQCGAYFRQLDDWFGVNKVPAAATKGSPAAVILCNDMIQAYNAGGAFGKNVFSSHFRSRKKKKRNQYQRYIFKNLSKVIDFKYDCGVTINGMKKDDIREGLQLFMVQVK